jgi:hypothetical protein
MSHGGHDSNVDMGDVFAFVVWLLEMTTPDALVRADMQFVQLKGLEQWVKKIDPAMKVS